jgi:hypothetical protein
MYVGERKKDLLWTLARLERFHLSERIAHSSSFCHIDVDPRLEDDKYRALLSVSWSTCTGASIFGPRYLPGSFHDHISPLVHFLSVDRNGRQSIISQFFLQPRCET